jgi:hypothetical protein
MRCGSSFCGQPLHDPQFYMMCALMDEAAVEETSGRFGSLTGEFEEHTAATWR